MASSGRRAGPRRPLGHGVAFLALLVLTLGSRGAAQQPGRSSGTAARASAARDSALALATPGRPVTAVFPVFNGRSNAVTQEVSAVLPEGWRILSGGGALHLSPRERRTLLIQVAVPSSAVAGIYPVILVRRAVTGPAGIWADTLMLRVREVRSLELVTTTAPTTVRAGATYTVQYVVRNRSNRAEQVRVTVAERSGFPVDASWHEAQLASGESRPLTIVVTTPAKIERQMRHALTLRAASVDTMSADTISARASSSVLVVPSRASNGARHHELPMRIRLISSSAPSASGARSSSTTVEVSGGGPLREKGNTRLSFLLRGPSSTGYVFNERDEYRVALTSPHLDISIGDQVFALTPLTGYSRAGAGIRVLAKAGGFGIGGLAYRDRRGFLGDEGRVGTIQYERPRTGSLRLNVVEKTGPDSARIASLQTRLALSPLATVDAELARTFAADTAAGAYLVQLFGTSRRFSYLLSQRRADEGFTARERGTSSVFGRVDARLIGQFGVRASAGEDHSTFDLFPVIWRTTRQSRFADATAYLGGALSAGYRVATRRTVTGSDTLDVAERSLRFSGSLNAGPVGIRAGVEAGEVTASNAPASGPSLRTTLQASHFGRHGSISLFADRFSGYRWYLPTAEQEQVSAGISALLAPTRWMSLRVNASGTRDLRHDLGTLVNADATLAVSPRPGHELSIRARAAGYNVLPDAEPAIRIAYSLPIGVPIGHSRNGGRLIARVYDIESGRGVRNATVLVGDRMAMTDDQGRVEIDGVPEGIQYLQLDLGAAAAHRIPAQPLPLRITSRSGATARVELAVARAIKITGSVRRLSPRSMGTWDGSRQALADTTYLQGIAVTLSRDGEAHTKLTDAGGMFVADDLRPGRWTITVSSADLPAQHYVEASPITLDIAPGQQASAQFDVLPRKRTLVMVDQAEIIADRVPTTGGHAMQPRPAERAERAAATPNPRISLFMGQSYYAVGKTDRTLENIALIIYGDIAMWPKLWVANRHQVAQPDEVRAGLFLLIPPKGPLTATEIKARDMWRRRGRSSPMAR